jgi:type VI secretion system protein VasI
MKIKLFSVAAFIATCSIAAAQDATQCAQISNPDDRLNCFDSLYKEVSIPEAKGDWVVKVTSSPLDDTKTVVLTLNSDDTIRGKYGTPGPARMLIRCRENTTSIYLIFNDHFMSDIQGGGRVDYRIDQQSPSRKNMDVSTDNKALGLWSGGASIPWIKQLIESENLYVRATPFSESQVEANFTIKGLNESIQPLREACSW